MLNKTMQKQITIRTLKPADHTAWLPLWNGNNLGHINQALTENTWARLMDADSQICGLGAFEGKTMTGLVHYVLHPVTGSLRPVCYMQDLFVAPEHRNKGIGRALVEDVAKTGRRENWERMYWLAEAQNIAAQSLYKNLGIKLNFTLHVLPLGN